MAARRVVVPQHIFTATADADPDSFVRAVVASSVWVDRK